MKPRAILRSAPREQAQGARVVATVCGPGEVGPQCEYVSYLAGMEYGPKRVPMHTHLKADGNWLETAWGPADKCKYPKRRPDLAVEARNEQ